MKNALGPIFVILMLLAIIGCSTTKGQNSTQTKTSGNSIEGTWEMISNYNYDNGQVTDTIPLEEGYRQIKMYYNGKVMWTRYVPTDSAEWFGYGSYSTTDTTLTEMLEYMSASMRKIANANMEWNMKLDLEKDRYSQIFTDADGEPISSENYKRLD
ncbi:hypothetical protein RQM65_00265 [Pricia sp. S334]|uniref:Lipocalin-like domain-containing protein n=1 Tax=Pricia mediterranea TaxID=3076079 RepID=A0ABU3L036_9FLAO|nr:hypothetical protein [Pricia sp. S334]MDT7827095.1 hypothetical protein [Pricia sp. S334]